MNPKVSIIIPVYNSEATISRCIESVLSQTLREFELILVDDGSSDNSGPICEIYASKDERIKVIHKVNEGCSAARNDGIRTAKGDYIGFVDADDYIDDNMYSEMYYLANKLNLDVVEVGFRRLFGNEYTLLLPDPSLSAPNVTNKLIRKQLVDEYHLFFPTTSHMGEDLAFSAKVDLVSRNRKTLEIAPYNYILSDDSVSHKVDRRFDIFDSIDDILDFKKTITTENYIDLSEIIYRHAFDLPLYNITKSENRREYLRLLAFKIIKYRRYLRLRHKLRIAKHLFANYIKFNHEGIFNILNFAKGLSKKLLPH